MPKELRKHKRQQFQYPALIDLRDGSPLRACHLSDVSQSGARITVEAPDTIPDQFGLVLSQGGRTHRWCWVAWRSEMQLGVRFMPEPPKKHAVPDVAKLNV